MKINKFLLLAAAAAFAVACSNDDPSTELSLSAESFTVEAAGGTQTFNITTNADWKIGLSSGADWLTVNPTSGSGSTTVTVTVDPYEEAAGRSAVITVTADNLIKSLAVIQTRPVVPGDPTVSDFSLRAGAKEIVVAAPAGFAYKVVIPEDAKFITTGETTKESITLNVAANDTGEAREAAVTVCTSDNKVLQTINVKQGATFLNAGDFLLEEVFFTQTLDEANSTAVGEQYFKITNNADETLYADGLLVGLTSFFSCQQSSVAAYWMHDDLDDAICIDDAFQIPGDGDDYPVKPGESIVIALAAQDFSKDNANAIDLSGADFEVYNENDRYPDIDNPDVPNVTVLFQSSASITMLHDRGYQCYAIFTLPGNVTAEQFADEYKYDGSLYFIMNGKALVTTTIQARDKTAHAVPNEWVVDGINCGVEQYFRACEFNSTVDAGYTGCGSIDRDPGRYGKSVLRKSEGGKLVDTNNSTNDFTRDATPTLKK